MSGARNASGSVIRMERSVLPSRRTSDSKDWHGSDRSSSSQRWASRRAPRRDRPRVGAHWPSAGLPIGDALNDLALTGEGTVHGSVSILAPASASTASDNWTWIAVRLIVTRSIKSRTYVRSWVPPRNSNAAYGRNAQLAVIAGRSDEPGQ